MGQRSSVIFYLNGKRYDIQPVSCTQTILQFLREQLYLTGTKEGCAEGDCGACTITEASLDADGHIHYRPVNACIRFVPTMDARVFWTVEGVADDPQRLHPVQQSIVDHHASQCGFCTPGFVMSLYALYAQGHLQPQRDQVLDQLSGNLCRCTGYRPIIEAALSLGRYPAGGPDHNTVARQLAELHDACREPLQITAAEQTWHSPRTISQLAAILQDKPDTVALAGGTDVGLWVTKQLRFLADVVYLGDIAELKHIHRNDHLHIGAAVLLDDACAVLVHEYPELNELWKRFASMPIRSSGTFVGNLANGSPIGDLAPILIALDARLVLRLGDQQRVLPLEELYVDYGKQARLPGEFIEAVLIPARIPGLRLGSYKLAKRFDQDISAVCSAYAVQLDDDDVVMSARIAHGGMAATTRRAYEAEAALLGEVWLEPAVRDAMQALATDYQPLTDMRASSAYRLRAAQNLLYRFYLETSGDTLTRVSGASHEVQ